MRHESTDFAALPSSLRKRQRATHAKSIIVFFMTIAVMVITVVVRAAMMARSHPVRPWAAWTRMTVTVEGSHLSAMARMLVAMMAVVSAMRGAAARETGETAVRTVVASRAAEAGAVEAVTMVAPAAASAVVMSVVEASSSRTAMSATMMSMSAPVMHVVRAHVATMRSAVAVMAMHRMMTGGVGFCMARLLAHFMTAVRSLMATVRSLMAMMLHPGRMSASASPVAATSMMMPGLTTCGFRMAMLGAAFFMAVLAMMASGMSAMFGMSMMTVTMAGVTGGMTLGFTVAMTRSAVALMATSSLGVTMHGMTVLRMTVLRMAMSAVGHLAVAMMLHTSKSARRHANCDPIRRGRGHFGCGRRKHCDRGRHDHCDRVRDRTMRSRRDRGRHGCGSNDDLRIPGDRRR